MEAITELVKEAVGEIRDHGMDSSKVLILDPLIRHNVDSLMGEVPVLMLALLVEDSVLVIQTLLALAYQTGIRVGRQQVMDEYLVGGEDEISGTKE